MNEEWFELFWISIKAAHQEALGFYIFHCFNIPKHISISGLFFLISVSCVVGFFCWIFENNSPAGGALALFLCPRGKGLALSLYPGGGEFALSKKFPGGWSGGWSGLELTDTLLLEQWSLQHATTFSWKEYHADSCHVKALV